VIRHQQFLLEAADIAPFQSRTEENVLVNQWVSVTG
jgi:hypothetical protein